MNERTVSRGGNKLASLPEPFDVGVVLRTLWKRRWAVASIFLVTVTAAAIRSFGATPIYRATTQVLIDRENPNIVNVQEVLAIDTADTDYYLTQYEILKSRSLAQRVIKSLKLDSDEVFNPSPRRTSLSKRLGLTGLIESVRGAFRKQEEKPGAEESQLQALTDRYLRSLSIEPVRNSRLVDISFECPDPRLAARIADAHGRLYIEASLDRKFSASQDAVEWLKGRITAIQAKLEASERALQKYRQENNLVSVDFEERHNIIVQKLGDLNAALTRARTDSIEKENLYAEFGKARSDPRMLESIPAVVNNSLIQRLKSEKVDLETKESELAQKFGPEHPKMISVRSELEELKKKINMEMYKIGESIELEYRMALAKEKSLLAALEEQKREALELNQKEIHYNVLKRETETERLMYENLLKRAKEASLTGGIRASNIAIVDPAYVPGTPVRPRRALNMFIAVVGGLALGLGLAALLEYLDNTIKNSEDVELSVEVPFLGTVRHFKKSSDSKVDGELVTASHPKSAVSEAFRNIRTNVLFSTLGTRGQTLLVTSASMLEGKTVFTCNLAVTLAQLQKKVLLVDADLRRPRIHKVFGIKDTPGLSDILTGQMPLDKCVRQTTGGNLSILPCGPIPPNPSELLSLKVMDEFIEEARQLYDIVLLDSPPVLFVTDPVIISKKVDGTIAIVRSGRTPRQALRRIISTLQEIEARVIGVVLNNVDVDTESYYYPYYYRYGKHGYYEQDDSEKERTASTRKRKASEKPYAKV